jgi:hypothetical protein
MLDIGEPVGFDISTSIAVPLKVCGVLQASEISDLLQDSIVGIFDYPASLLGKSTVFATYAAHRMIPVVVGYEDTRPADGLEPGKHYWLSDVEADTLSLEAGQTIADQAYAWYQPHKLSTQAKRFIGCLQGEYQLSNGNGINFKD